MKLNRALIALGALAVAAVPSYCINVTPTGDATALVNTLLGSGITLVGTPTLTGGNLDTANSSAGAFTNGLTTGIGIDTGIVLTSGQANLVDNANLFTNHTGEFVPGGGEAPGDSQLDPLVAPFTTHDATVLEFDFSTSSGDLFFQFVFASEEYNEWTNTEFTDVFGFFVDGINIALIPGTTTPIAINTVNATAGDHPELYNNNSPAGAPPPFAFSFDGFTDVFTVSALGLGAGTHTIKLAIADTSDDSLDSGVFIKAGSFKPTDPEEPTVPGVPDSGASIGLLSLGLALLAGARRFAVRA